MDNPASPPPISDEFKEVLKSRPELDADTVWQNFAEKNKPDAWTMGRWKKWVASEFAPQAGAVKPSPKGPDPELLRIERESKLATKPPANIRAQMAEIVGRMTA